MNWCDVKEFATRVEEAIPISDDDFQECWMNGKREVIEE